MNDAAESPSDLVPAPRVVGRSHLTRWIRDHTADLERFLARRNVMPSDINDICQEVFLRLLRFDRAEMVNNPPAYLYRVAANVAHDFRLRIPQWESLDSSEASRVPSGSTPDELADSDGRRRALMNALRNLPPMPRAALALQMQEDLSHEEIAQRLGISRRAVRKAVGRGHELIRQALAKG